MAASADKLSAWRPGIAPASPFECPASRRPDRDYLEDRTPALHRTREKPVRARDVQRAGVNPLANKELHNQDRHWNRHAVRYSEQFVDPYDTDVQTPLWTALEAIPDAASKTVADLGCGTGPLLPFLARRFSRVIAIDFAPKMLKLAAARLDTAAPQVTFLQRPMHELDELAGQLDVAVAINSLVMPDVRLIDRTLRSIRCTLKPGGLFLGVVPSIDTIYYHLLLLTDQALDSGVEPREARRSAELQIEPDIMISRSGNFASMGSAKSSGSRSKSNIDSARRGSHRRD